MAAGSDAVAGHRETVRAFARPGGALAADSPTVTMNNPAWFRPATGITAAGRIALHDRLIAECREQHAQARHDQRAIVLAGPPGAGKSTVLRTEVLGADQAAWLTIDADEFKRALLREAIADGSYDSFIKPAQVKEREVAGERFFPLELASLVHEESSMLAKRQLQREAIAEGTNVVIDTVLSKPDQAVSLGERLAGAGYTVEVIDVEVPFELSAARIEKRWHESYEEALETGDGLGGRWVPSGYACEVFFGSDGRSKPEESARLLAHACAAVLRYRVFRTPGEGAERVVETDVGRVKTGGQLLEYGLVEIARRAEVSRAKSHVKRPGPGRPSRGAGRE
ncbi:MAG: zeta toxin family protein [Propionibacterium sp.]|nr:zeta toxin family protein [Propionibacterium sp.]